MRFLSDPLEDWAVHCHRRGATISLDSSGASTPGPDEFPLRVEELGDEAEAEAEPREALCRAYGVDDDMIASPWVPSMPIFLFFLTHLTPSDKAVVESPTFMPIRRQAEEVTRVSSLSVPRRRRTFRTCRTSAIISGAGAKVVALTQSSQPLGRHAGR